MAQTLDFAKIKAHLDGISEGFVDKEAKAGWFDSARYPDGTPVAYVATIQEYGAPEVNIPPRPFLAPTIEKRKDAWVKLLSQGVKAVARGGYSADQVLEGVGLQVAGDIQAGIASVTGPALSNVTLLLRKWRREGKTIAGKTVGEAAAAIKAGASIEGVNADPLRDSGLMVATVTSVVGPVE